MWLPSPSYTCKTPSSFLGGYPWMQSDTNRCKAFTFSRGFYIFPFCQPQSYLPGTDWTAITKAVGPEWGLSIALRLGWLLRSPQMLVTRVRNFYVWGTAYALSPEKKKNNYCSSLCVYLCLTSKKTLKVLNTFVWPNNFEKENSKSQRYMVFPSGHPSKY